MNYKIYNKLILKLVFYNIYFYFKWHLFSNYNLERRKFLEYLFYALYGIVVLLVSLIYACTRTKVLNLSVISINSFILLKTI